MTGDMTSHTSTQHDSLQSELSRAFDSGNDKWVSEVLQRIIDNPQIPVRVSNRVIFNAKCLECEQWKPVWTTVRTPHGNCLHYCAYCWSCD